MLKILKNLEQAEAGNKPSASTASKNDMKRILESLSECGTPMEGGCMPEPQMPAQANPGSPVSMNVSINASGKENVDDLINLMKMAGIGGGETHIDMPGAHDAMHTDIDSHKQGMSMADMARMMDMGPEEGEEELEQEEFDNAPDENYSDHEYMTKDLSGGLNRQKKQYKAAQPGDNAMRAESIKQRLWAALQEKKKS